MTRHIVFCDIDGTISDDRPRGQLLIEARKIAGVSQTRTTKHYDEYHSSLHNDDIFPNTVNYLMARHKEGKKIVFITARNDKWRLKTVDWFIERCPQLWKISQALCMRDDLDLRPSEQVKYDHIYRIITNRVPFHGIIDTLIDDDEDVLDYLRMVFPTARPLLARGGILFPYPNPIQSTESPSTESPTVDAALKKLADIYLERNALYKDNYKNFGTMMMALQNFVPGGSFPTETEDDWNRLCLLFMLASKVSRYCASYMDGGHPDSLDDSSVYAQMLNEIDREIRSLEQG